MDTNTQTVPEQPSKGERIVTGLASVAAAFKPSTADRKWWQSKSLWAAALTVAAGFYPPAQAIVIAYPEATLTVVGGVFTVLRLITAGKIVAK